MEEFPRLSSLIARLKVVKVILDVILSCSMSYVMARKSILTAIFGILLSDTAMQAQVQVPPAPWRGAGTPPCVGSDGGVYQCPQAPRLVAVRAGRLFDSNTGTMLTRQVVIVFGERITEVGSESQV